MKFLKFPVHFFVGIRNCRRLSAYKTAVLQHGAERAAGNLAAALSVSSKSKQSRFARIFPTELLPVARKPVKITFSFCNFIEKLFKWFS